MPHVLVVDDEQSICWGLVKLAENLGYSATAVGSAEQGLNAARQQQPNLILLDVRLPGMDGLTALEKFSELLGPVPVIMMTAYGELETAVEAIRRGAFEYLVKPFDLDLAERTIQRAFTLRPQASEEGTQEAPRDSSAQPIIGQSSALQEVFKQIALVAPTDACVHLWGESGTGKELVARAIHRYSRRADGPFVPVNLASLSPALAESELFGHVRGAFTGAQQSRRGFLEQAHGGTLFLDEVADIPLPLQVKLLRALEHGEIWPVGADQPCRSDFRVVSATHQDLRQRVTDGQFRHDLYFRLNTFQIEIPTLRRRREDIPVLARYFVTALSARTNASPSSLSEEALDELGRRPWHGNVRELRNAIEHALILARGGAITPAHLSPAAPAVGPEESTDPEVIQRLLQNWVESELQGNVEPNELHAKLLELVEPPLLSACLEAARGQVLTVARWLGLHRTTVAKKLQQYRLEEK